MPVLAVTLDVGGTLLREVSSRSRIYTEAARRRGLELTETEMGLWMHRTHEELSLEWNGCFRYSDDWFRAFIERIYCGELGLDPRDLPDLQSELFDRFSDPSTFRLFPGALELLQRLRSAEVRIGIVSNWSPRLKPILTGLGVTGLVDGIWVSAIERVEKPTAEIFLRACRGLNVEPSAALHAGDHPEKDVEGARAAGLRAVLVDPSGAHEDHDGHRVRNLLDLLDCIPNLRHDRT